MGRVAHDIDALPVRSGAQSSVTPDLKRYIDVGVRHQLIAQSAGFCQFDGCELSLIEHHVTKQSGNFSDQAHIVAFSEGGPRGDAAVDKAYINSLENLMLLCKGCHKLIDENSGTYSRRSLEQMKYNRVELLREAIRNRASELRTWPIVMEAPIGGRPTLVADYEVRAAISPRHPWRRNPLRIPMNNLMTLNETSTYYAAAAELIDQFFSENISPGAPLLEAQHISIFAIAPIPLLVKFGASLPDKIPIQIHHKRNNPSTWVWNSEGETLRFGLRIICEGSRDGPVGLAISISGAVPVGDLANTLGRNSTIYEVFLEGWAPARTAFQTQADLEAFKEAYCSALGTIATNHGVSAPIHLFPAVPAAVAVACGLMRHPKAHGPLNIYDLRDGAYRATLEIGR